LINFEGLELLFKGVWRWFVYFQSSEWFSNGSWQWL